VLNKPGNEASPGTLGCYLSSECYVANNRVPPSALYKFGSVGIQKILALQIFMLCLEISGVQLTGGIFNSLVEFSAHWF